MSDGALGDRIDNPAPTPPPGGPPAPGLAGLIASAIGCGVVAFDWVLTPFRSRVLYCRAERGARWLIGNPLLSGQVALYMFLAWGVIGGELGLTDLFWHEHWLKQFWVGVATSWLFGTVLFVTILLRGFAPDHLPDVPTEKEWTGAVYKSLFPSHNPGVRRVGRWILCWLLGLAAAVYAGKLAAVEFGRRTFTTDAGGAGWGTFHHFGLMFLAGYAVGFAAIYLLSLFDDYFQLRETVARREWLVAPAGVAACAGDPEPHPAPRPGQPGFHRYHTLLLLHAMAVTLGVAIVVALALVLVWVVAAEDQLSPAILLSLVLMLFDVVGGMVAFRVRGARTLGVVVLGFVALGNWNAIVRHKMTYPDIADEMYTRDRELPLGGDEYRTTYRTRAPAGGLIDAESLLRQFRDNWQNPPGQPARVTKPRLVLVAVSGGGIRAAVWTGVVLEGLEKEFDGADGGPAMRDHVRVIAGASGGMVGAAAYVGDFDAGPLPQDGRDAKSGLLPFAQALAGDSLTPIVQTMVLRDFTVNTVLPCRFGEDRGRTLEWAWDRNFAAAGWRNGSPYRRTFAELRGDKAAKTGEWGARRPSLVFSPIMVEDTKRLLVSNLDLGSLTDPRGHRLDADGGPGVADLSMTGVEFFRMFPDADRFRIGSAARMSATFPVVSPAVALPVKPIRRVADAGYFDNYGIDVLGNWLLHHRKEVTEYTSGVLLVQVRAYPLEKGGTRFGAEPQSPIDLIVGAVSAPLQALLTARGSSAFHRNNELLAAVHRAYNTGPERRADFVTSVTFEQDKDAALSWYLTTEEKKQVASGFYNDRTWKPRADTDNNVQKKLDAVRTWWAKP